MCSVPKQKDIPPLLSLGPPPKSARVKLRKKKPTQRSGLSITREGGSLPGLTIGSDYAGR